MGSSAPETPLMQEANPDEELYAHHKHQPAHLFRPGAAYFITAKTLHAEPYLAAEPRRQELLDALEFAARKRGWELLAWVTLADHYHALLQAPEREAKSLSALLGSVHSFTSRSWNEEDGEQGRRVWYQYWDVCLTSQSGFYARLNYIHYNPVKHGYVSAPGDYPHSSYLHWLNRDRDELREIEAIHPWDRLELEY